MSQTVERMRQTVVRVSQLAERIRQTAMRLTRTLTGKLVRCVISMRVCIIHRIYFSNQPNADLQTQPAHPFNFVGNLETGDPYITTVS